MSPEEENEQYSIPCPYHPEVMCVQLPISKEEANEFCNGGNCICFKEVNSE